jgi:hypothetical protein
VDQQRRRACPLFLHNTGEFPVNASLKLLIH